jgi:hypothetical protein
MTVLAFVLGGATALTLLALASGSSEPDPAEVKRLNDLFFDKLKKEAEKNLAKLERTEEGSATIVPAIGPKRFYVETIVGPPFLTARVELHDAEGIVRDTEAVMEEHQFDQTINSFNWLDVMRPRGAPSEPSKTHHDVTWY